VRVCVCVAPEGVCGVSARRVLGEMPQWHGRDANATSRSRRGGVGVHGEAVAQAWRGWMRLGLAAWVRTHARGAWLPRAAVWPCRARGTGIPGPRHDAAAGGRRRLRGAKQRVGLLQEQTARRPEGREVLRVSTEGSSAAQGSRRQQGKEKGGGSSAHRRGWSRGCSGQR
jgi:hypothetical protein